MSINMNFLKFPFHYKSSRIGMRGMDWIDLAQDMDRWRALANAVMKFRVP